jgi:vacuolar-type H+-ATPase subunit H
MGKLLVVSQERQARTRIKIMEDEYMRKNRKAKYYEREKILGKGTANIQRRIVTCFILQQIGCES